MLLELIHETQFVYSEPVREAFMEFRLTPLTDVTQHLLQHRHRVTPLRPLRQYRDGWGNTVTYFNLMEAHERIEVSFESAVETYPLRWRGHGAAGEPHGPEQQMAQYDFLRPTPLTEPCAPFLEFAAPLEHLRGAPVEGIAEEVRETLYRSFRYERHVTSASSPIGDILSHGAGVCQDFAHLMLATVRHLGCPARYVSGYVLPDGEEAAASHAWCELFDPDRGWLGVDPTHNCWAEERYIRIGVGRDYRDVPPNRGLYRGDAGEELRVSVRLRPITADLLESRARRLFPPPPRVTAGPGTRRKPQPTLMEQAQPDRQQQQQQQ